VAKRGVVLEEGNGQRILVRNYVIFERKGRSLASISTDTPPTILVSKSINN
jgi:hypothetical protein